MPFLKKNPPARVDKNRIIHNKKGVIFLSLLFLLIFPLATIKAGRKLEKHNGFCVSCHEMEHVLKEWQESGASEKHPECIQCHSGPGLLGEIESQWRGVKFTISHFTLPSEKLKPPFKAKVPITFCTQCHSKEKIIPIHRRFDTQGKQCADCHKHREGWEFLGELRG